MGYDTRVPTTIRTPTATASLLAILIGSSACTDGGSSTTHVVRNNESTSSTDGSTSNEDGSHSGGASGASTGNSGSGATGTDTDNSTSTRSNQVTVNGIRIEPGTPIAGTLPSGGLCMLSAGETTLQACKEILGEPSFEERRDETTVIAFNYESGLLLAFVFEDEVLSDIVVMGSASGLECLPDWRYDGWNTAPDGGWYTRPIIDWRDAGARSSDSGM